MGFSCCVLVPLSAIPSGVPTPFPPYHPTYWGSLMKYRILEELLLCQATALSQDESSQADSARKPSGQGPIQPCLRMKTVSQLSQLQQGEHSESQGPEELGQTSK